MNINSSPINSNPLHGVGKAVVFTPVSFSHISTYSLFVSFSHVSKYDILETKSFAYVSKYDLLAFDVIQTAHISKYSIRFSASHISKYDIRGTVSFSHITKYNLTSTVSASHVSEYDIQAFNPVSFSHVTRYRIEGPIKIDVTGQPKIILEGRDIDIISAHVYKSETSLHWACSVDVSKKEDYQLFQRDQAFTLEQFGESYAFIVDSKELSRGDPSSVSMKLGGVSPTALLDAPRTQPVELPITTADIGAQEYVETVLLPTATINWGILDWNIPAGRLGAGNTIPLKYASDIIAVVGGVLEATKAGTLNVRKKWKETPETMIASPNSVADITITEADGLMSISEQYIPDQTTNKYRVIDIEEYFADVVEQEAQSDPRKVDVYVYPSPVRTDILLSTTSPSNRAVLSAVGGLETLLVEGSAEDPGELVEIVNSEGSVRYPINSIVEVIWVSDPLGSVTFTEGSNTIRTTDPANGYGYLYIRYNTQRLQYLLEGLPEPFVAGESEVVYPTQLILEDL